MQPWGECAEGLQWGMILPQGFLQVERKAKLEGFILHVFLTILLVLPGREQRSRLLTA